jgi:hypothetical protein
MLEWPELVTEGMCPEIFYLLVNGEMHNLEIYSAGL